MPVYKASVATGPFCPVVGGASAGTGCVVVPILPVRQMPLVLLHRSSITRICGEREVSSTPGLTLIQMGRVGLKTQYVPPR